MDNRFNCFQLEAEDIPPDDRVKDPKCLRYIRNEKIFADRVTHSKEDIFTDLNEFEKTIAKPVEKILSMKFMNVYENRDHFCKKQD